MGRTAVLSDVHGNPPALRAVLEDIDLQGCGEILVLGDILNGLDPSGSVELLLGLKNVTAIRGNAENYTFTPNLDAFPRRDEPMYADLIPVLRWFEAHLTAEQAGWLRSLPNVFLRERDCFVHDSPQDRLEPAAWHKDGLAEEYQEISYHAPGISREMPGEKWDELAGFCQKRGISRVFCGHTHVPFIHEVDGLVVCNTGSAGFSLDGDPRVAWVLIDEDNSLTIRRVAYDMDETLALVDRSSDYPSFTTPGMQAAYRKMLQTGIHWRAHLNHLA